MYFCTLRATTFDFSDHLLSSTDCVCAILRKWHEGISCRKVCQSFGQIRLHSLSKWSHVEGSSNWFYFAWRWQSCNWTPISRLPAVKYCLDEAGLVQFDHGALDLRKSLGPSEMEIVKGDRVQETETIIRVHWYWTVLVGAYMVGLVGKSKFSLSNPQIVSVGYVFCCLQCISLFLIQSFFGPKWCPGPKSQELAADDTFHDLVPKWLARTGEL